MEVKRGTIVIEGMDVIIQRDLDKHKDLLERDNLNIQSFHAAMDSEIQRKRYYGDQKGKRNYDDDAMDTAIAQMSKNINHYSYRIKVTEELKKQNTLIVDTLTKQLREHYSGLKMLAQARKEELDANHS